MLALDEQRDGDEAFEVNGFNFVVDKELFEQAKPLTVDMTYMGFQVHSNLQLGGGGCSSGSCGTGSSGSCAC